MARLGADTRAFASELAAGEMAALAFAAQEKSCAWAKVQRWEQRTDSGAEEL